MQKDGSGGFGGDKRDGGGRRNILWNNFGSHHAFTTGRQRASETNFGNKVRPKGPSQTLKVKNEVRTELLNSKTMTIETLNEFNIISLSNVYSRISLV